MYCIDTLKRLNDAARINNLSIGTLVYPIIDHGYQFSVSLAVYY